MLKQLYQLQELETAERGLNEERLNSEEYQQLRGLKAAFDQEKDSWQRLNTAIARLEAKLGAAATRSNELEQRLGEERQAMYDGSVTNPKEQSAREAQAAALERKLEAVQEERTQHQQQLISRQEEAGRLHAALTDKQAEFSRVRDIYQQAQAGRDAQAAELEAQKAALLPLIPAEELAWFESQREKFANTPVAMLDSRQVCSGCHTMAPPVAFKRILGGQTICCEKCGRTLFVDGIDGGK